MSSTHKYIAQTLCTTTTSSITFSSIPTTYTDLVIYANARTDYSGGASYEQLWFRFNGTGSGYSETGIYFTGAANGAFLGDRTDYLYKNNYVPSSSTSNYNFGTAKFYLPEYKNTSHSKLIIGYSNANFISTNSRSGIVVGRANTTSAISTISIISGFGSFVAGSVFSLYGIA